MSRQRSGLVPMLVAITLAGLLGGCDSEIIYRNLPSFEEPLAGAGDFLGYSAVEQKRTVCGNCHVGKQRDWLQTAHAGAWDTQKEHSTQAVCGSCHAVSARGNTSDTESVGWVGSQHARYQDVQCESCHGAGLTHVLDPDVRGSKPRAPIAVELEPAFGCAACHSGPHSPQADEWSGSRHARLVTGTRVTNANCTGCHEAKDVLASWGFRTSFLEHGDATPLTVTCAVCHDPHTAGTGKQLRFAVNVASMEDNLCMKCHQRRASPDVASAAGPHSPEGPLLLGSAGWFPPDFPYAPGTLIATHGSGSNPGLCVTCHMSSYTITDAPGGAFRSTGHTFEALPCVDEAGVPSGAHDCGMEARSFRSCTGCHLGETGARTALAVAELRLQRLAGEIEALLPHIPSTEFSTTDGRISTGEGARFNMQLARKGGSAVHNPFLMEALLIASIQQIELEYGLPPATSLSLDAELVPR
jgi:predicted CXXCH cytochrome family protein